MSGLIATGWRKLSGEKNWEGLLQPLHPNLRTYLIHYAQMAGAVGDLFNGDTREPEASKQDFFSKACLVKGNPYKYDVTHFLYAGSDFVDPSWFGYVAVATDEGKHALGRRDIVIAWRGTSGTREWLNDFNFIIQVSASDLFPTAREHDATLHKGFHDLYTGTRPDETHTKISVREQVLNAVKELVNRYEDEEISITLTGFSLGAAFATLSAMDIVANGYNKPTTGNLDKSVMVTAFTYGGPRVGNAGLARVFHGLSHHLHLLCIKNDRDIIPTLPPGMFSYTDFGIKFIVDTYKSKYLKWKGPFGKSAAFPEEYEDEDQDELNGIDSLDDNEHEHEPKRKRTRRDIVSLDEDEDEYGLKRKRVRGAIPQYYSCHNMDVYAHGVAIRDIGKNTPVDKLEYDIALVNKYLDRVKNEYKIPPNWWVGENRKKMFQLENGRWMVV